MISEKKTRFPKKSWFFQTRDEPMTNPYDNPWFFHWLGPFRIGWILLDFHWRLYKQFWEVFSESSGISGICINCNFLIFVRLPTSSHQTSMCWAKVCISRCGRSWGVILETQGFQTKHRVFFKPYEFFGFGGTRSVLCMMLPFWLPMMLRMPFLRIK